MAPVSNRALGVSCTPRALFFAVVQNGQVLDVEPQKVDVPVGLKRGPNLDALRTELHHRLAEAAPAAAALLQPNGYDGGINASTARVGAETILRMTAHDLDVEVELLNRATARKRLGLGASGKLDDKLKELFPTAIGRYWADGRRLAAFAALACEKELV